MIEKKISEWVEGVKLDLIASYDSRKLRASGRWANELETNVSVTESNAKAYILGSEYTGIMITGRKPNTKPQNIKAFVGWAGSTFIADWVKAKGLSLNPFAVAYNIATRGVTVPNQYNDGQLINSVITPERIDELGRTVGMTIIDRVKSDFIKTFKR